MENSVNKQCRPWSDTTKFGIWSGSAMFAYDPLTGFHERMGWLDLNSGIWFRTSEPVVWTKTGGVELVSEHLNQLWQLLLAVAVYSIPGVGRYVARHLFLWMSQKQCEVKLYCSQLDSEKREQEMTSARINRKVRQVTNTNGFYNMACHNLECMKWRHRVLSWSHVVFTQLDVRHRVQLPCILTAKSAWDTKVVHLLRNRGLGNIGSQIQKKIEKKHGEKGLQPLSTYRTVCPTNKQL